MLWGATSSAFIDVPTRTSPVGRPPAVQIGSPADLSLNAEVWVPSWDRAGLERLLHYCARPVFASERLAWIEPDQQLVYHLPKSGADGKTAPPLTPLEFLDRIAALVPPLRKHRHRYHGLLAPNSPLRPAVTACAGQPPEPSRSSVPTGKDTPASSEVAETRRQSPACYSWAALIARIYQVLPLLCPECGFEIHRPGTGAAHPSLSRRTRNAGSADFSGPVAAGNRVLRLGSIHRPRSRAG